MPCLGRESQSKPNQSENLQDNGSARTRRGLDRPLRRFAGGRRYRGDLASVTRVFALRSLSVKLVVCVALLVGPSAISTGCGRERPDSNSRTPTAVRTGASARPTAPQASQHKSPSPKRPRPAYRRRTGPAARRSEAVRRPETARRPEGARTTRLPHLPPRPPIPADVAPPGRPNSRLSRELEAELDRLRRGVAPKCRRGTVRAKYHGAVVCLPTVPAPHIADIFAIGAPCLPGLASTYRMKHRRCSNGRIVAR